MSIAVNGIPNIAYIFKLQGIQTVKKEAALLRQPPEILVMAKHKIMCLSAFGSSAVGANQATFLISDVV
jgi:hypothetical protein